MSISDIQVLLGPVAEQFFPGEGSLKLTEVYEEIMNLELEQIWRFCGGLDLGMNVMCVVSEANRVTEIAC